MAFAFSKNHCHTHLRATSPLQLVHFDVWGSSLVPSLFGYKYNICFIDDFSQFTWLYPFTYRDQFFNILKSFHVLVETQL